MEKKKSIIIFETDFTEPAGGSVGPPSQEGKQN